MKMSLAVLLLTVPLWGCRTQIHHGLEEREANELVSALVARGYQAHKVSEKGKKLLYAVEVPDASATDALRVLTELKLPRAPRSTTQGLTQGLIDTPSAEKLRQLEALEGDIETALEGMDGVTTASVELVVPPPARPGQEPTTSKAGVLLRVSPGALERLDRSRAELRALVAGSAEGLKLENVTLVLDPVTTNVEAPVVMGPGPELLRLRWMVFALSLSILLLTGVIMVLLRRPRVVKSSRKATPAEPVAAAVRAVSSTDLPRRVTPTKPLRSPSLHSAA
jgi:type III secretion protein J